MLASCMLATVLSVGSIPSLLPPKDVSNEETFYATADNGLLWSSQRPDFENTVYSYGGLSVGCNWDYRETPYGDTQDWVCGSNLTAFDLSTVDGTINSAVLTFYVNDTPADWDTLYELWAVAEDWSGNSATFSNRPDVWTGTSRLVEPSAYKVDIDVTDIVQLWVDGHADNHGFYFSWTGFEFPYATTYRATQLCGSENYTECGGSHTRPQLHIQWTTSDTPPIGTTYAQVATTQFFNCGLLADGSVDCWNHPIIRTPYHPEGTYKQITGGGWHACGLLTNGLVECWGVAFGDTPMAFFSQISAGFAYTCGVRTDGSIECWGDNSYGQLDAPSGAFLQVSAGEFYACGVRTDGSVECWGTPPDNYGQTVAPSGVFTQVSAFLARTCGLKQDGSVVCWGRDTINNTPAQSPEGVFAHVSAGGMRDCALRLDGSVHCWLGGLPYNWDFEPGDTASSGYYVQISNERYHTCGVRASGEIDCWGEVSSWMLP